MTLPDASMNRYPYTKNGGSCRKEADMKSIMKANNNKLNILYARLSRDDGEDSISNSIKNQQQMLVDYAEKNNLTPYRFFKK